MNKKKLIITLSIVFGTLILLLGAFFIYVGIYYHADTTAIEGFDYVGFEERETDDGVLAYVPNTDFDTGVIFYPGGKVEYEAYIPLMEALASKGILSILVDMPFNLAVFDTDRATGVFEGFFMVENWYMAGHSLGGSMACKYVKENQQFFKGVILLGSYSTENLSDTSLSVLSIYGSEDKVLNREKYEENKSNLPKNTKEYVINGGNHAYFGVYGEQKGDGTATVTNAEQIEITALQILDFVTKTPSVKE